jgi:hypothetical protein
MKRVYYVSFSIFFLFILSSSALIAQAVNHYTVTRTTGITYNSIASTGSPATAWRNSGTYIVDDNRSYSQPIGFDFWYNGTRYTTFCISTNGYMDFSSSTATGGPVTTAYGYQNTAFSAGTVANGTWLALAPIYDDMTTQGAVDPLSEGIRYQVDGTAPNRILTVEWIHMAIYQNTNPDMNFQVKLYETTGVIEFVYGTMNLGTGWTPSYTCGINAATISGTPTAAQLLVQQTANSTTFNNTVQNNLVTLPTSNSLIRFTPLTPIAPTNLTFTAVTQSSMTLNWTDNATNEVGYAIYNSLDGTNYNYVTQIAANSTSYPAAGLIAGTTYYWQVYAVTEGRVSSSLNGSQATNPAASFTSIRTGNWNTITTWDKNSVPSVGANVTIANGHTVTIDVGITVNNLNIGQGTSGVLLIGNSTTARTLNVLGNITVSTGAQFMVNTSFASSAHILNLTSNIVNNGTFDFGPSATSRCQAVFNRTGSQTISGTGATTRFYLMTLNMGTSNSNVLDIISSNFSSQSTGFLTITNGTFKYEAPSAITPFAASFDIPLTGGMWINNSSAAVTTTGGNLSVSGFLRITNGILNVGTAADQSLISDGGDIIIEGGTVNVAGSFNRTNTVTTTQLSITGGTMRVATTSSTSTTLAPFMMDVPGSSFNWSGGNVIIVREGGTGATNLGYIDTGATSYSITGGTLQIGDFTTPAAQTMQINTDIPVFNFVDSSVNATAQLVTNNLLVNNNILLAAGTLDANNLNIIIKGNWIKNAGTFTTGTGIVNFNGINAQNIGGSSATTFYNLTLDNSTGLSLSNSVTVTGILTLANGAFSIGANTLTFQTSNTPIVRTSGTITTTTSSNLIFGTIGNTGGTAFAIPASTFTTAPFLNNFTINRTNSLTLNNQMMSLNGTLLCNGPLTTNGNLTLLSTAIQTALINGTSTGTVSGNVTMQRYLPSGFGYKYISSPFQASTVNEFSNDLDLTASFPTFYQYVENRASSGWVSYTTTTNVLNPMQGYAANFGSVANPKTVDVTGVVNNGAMSITLKNDNQPYTLGFNLVGNPYPSPVNWTAAAGWTKTNIDNALYYFQAGSTDQYTGTYSTYINGVSSDGLATNVIPSMQGFFVHVSNGTFPVTGTLAVTNNIRTNDLTHAFLKSVTSDSLPLLRIAAGFADDGTPSDPTVIYFDSSATQFFDKNFDALKLMNTDIHVPNLYTLAPDSSRLSINAMPFSTDSITRIRIGLKTAIDGWITFKTSDLKYIPAGEFMYLADNVAGIYQTLKLNSTYRVFLKAGQYETRFSLVFSKTIINSVSVNSLPTEFSLLQNYPNPFNPSTTIKYSIPQTSFVCITIYDILGKEVSKLVNEEKQSGSYEVQFNGSKFSSGVYFYRMNAGKYDAVKKLVLLK